MSIVLPVVLTLLLGVYALVATLGALRALGVKRRIQRMPTQKIGALRDGPAEIAGRIHSETPLKTVLGEDVIVLRTEIETSYKSGQKTYRDPFAAERTSAAPAAITDDSGTVRIDVAHVLPIGPRRRTVFAAADFGERFPDLWEPLLNKDTMIEVRVDEIFVPNDVTVFASGEAVARGEPTAGEDYREAHAKLVVGPSGDRPLILSAWSEAEIERHLARPIVMLATCAVLACTVIAVLWTARVLIARAAGI